MSRFPSLKHEVWFVHGSPTIQKAGRTKKVITSIVNGLLELPNTGLNHTGSYKLQVTKYSYVCNKHITGLPLKEAMFKVTVPIFGSPVRLDLIAWNGNGEGWGVQSWEKEQNWYWKNNIPSTLDNVIHNNTILQNEAIALLFITSVQLHLEQHI